MIHFDLNRLLTAIKHIPPVDDEEMESLERLIREVSATLIAETPVDWDRAIRLWSELYLRYAWAYSNAIVQGNDIIHSAEDEESIQSIYAYARWCLLEVSDPEIYTAVVVNFFEGLGVNRYARAEINRYMAPDVFAIL
jgi:hypothetical protein